MVQAGVAPSLIVSHIRSSQTTFNLSTAELIRLTKAGVPEPVLQAMRDPSGASAAASAAAQNRTVTISGGAPFEITLTQSVDNDCVAGQPLRFRVSEDVKAGDAVVVAKGAVVNGVIVEPAKKKFLVHTTRPTYRLLEVPGVDGSRLKLRATAGRLGDSRKDPSLEPIGGAKSKDVLAPAGSRFLAWFDGDQTVTVRQ